MSINGLTHLYPLPILPNPNPPKSPSLTPLLKTIKKLPVFLSFVSFPLPEKGKENHKITCVPPFTNSSPLVCQLSQLAIHASINSS